MQQPRWLIVQSDERTQEQMRLACERSAPVTAFSTVEDALRWLQDSAQPPALVGMLVAWELHDGRAVELIRLARAHQPVPALITSGSSNQELLRHAFRLEATLLCTPIERADLLAFIERAMNRSKRHDERVLRLSRAFAARHALSPREQEILAAVMAGKIRDEIAPLLHISQSTLKWHVNALLRKCKARSLSEAACTALRDTA